MPMLTALFLCFAAAQAQEADSARAGERGLAPALGPAPLYLEFSGQGQAQLSAEARRQLRQTLPQLQLWQGQKIAIEGHTCACGTAQENRGLALKRAEAVRGELVAQGLQAMVLHLLAWGEEKPLAAGPDRNLSPLACASDPVHAVNNRVLIRPWQPEDVHSAATLVLPPAPTAQASLWYRPRGQQGPFQQLKEGAVLHSGDELQVFFSAQEPVHVYIFHRGSAGDWLCLFPNPSLSQNAANPLEPGRQYWVPGLGLGLPLDETPGVEETFVYLSPVPELEMVRWAVEGVPWKEEPRPTPEAQPKTRGLAGVVSIRPALDTLPWFMRVRFRHEP